VIYLFKVYLLVIGVVLLTTLVVAVATAIAKTLLTTARRVRTRGNSAPSVILQPLSGRGQRFLLSLASARLNELGEKFGREHRKRPAGVSIRDSMLKIAVCLQNFLGTGIFWQDGGIFSGESIGEAEPYLAPPHGLETRGHARCTWAWIVRTNFSLVENRC
jgi:hypothetical protein